MQFQGTTAQCVVWHVNLKFEYSLHSGLDSKVKVHQGLLGLHGCLVVSLGALSEPLSTSCPGSGPWPWHGSQYQLPWCRTLTLAGVAQLVSSLPWLNPLPLTGPPGPANLTGPPGPPRIPGPSGQTELHKTNWFCYQPREIGPLIMDASNVSWLRGLFPL